MIFWSNFYLSRYCQKNSNLNEWPETQYFENSYFFIDLYDCIDMDQVILEFCGRQVFILLEIDFLMNFHLFYFFASGEPVKPLVNSSNVTSNQFMSPIDFLNTSSFSLKCS